MVNVFAKSMVMNPYPSANRNSLSVDMEWEEYVAFERLPKIEKAAKILKRLEIEMDRQQVTRAWLTYGTFNGEQLRDIEAALEADKARRRTEDEEAYAKLITAGIDVLEEGEVFVQTPVPEMPEEGSETTLQSIPDIAVVESKPKTAKRRKTASKKGVSNGD